MAATAKKRDYYEVLGVERGANQEQIKQAYRQLAMTYHPDRNRAPDATDRFREIAEAYAVLSDPAKREQYNLHGHAGVSQHWSTEDIFRDFDFGDFLGSRFGGFGGIFGDLFGARGRQGSPKPRGADLRHELSLSLEEAATGGEHVISISRSDRCKTCAGSGAQPGTAPISCAECGGSGQKQQTRADKAVHFVTITSCPRCLGRGVWIESPCLACHGSGLEFTPHQIKVQVPAGIDDGMMLRLAGQGEAAAAPAEPGDLLVRVVVHPHPRLTRDGDDLYATAAIDFASAALGSKIEIPCLAGEKVKVTIPPGTQSGTRLRLRGKGMPRLNSRGKGDLYVIVQVATPKRLSPRQRELLKEFRDEQVKQAATVS